MEQKERSVDDIRKDLEREGLNGDQHLADQARTELDLRALNNDAKRESDQLQRKLKDKDTVLKRLRKAGTVVQVASHPRVVSAWFQRSAAQHSAAHEMK